jgi:hypothetical protein
MGWLHATPKSKASSKNVDEQLVTRQTNYVNNGVEIIYPPCSMIYMVDYLFSAGPTISSPMGKTPLTHQEIYAWQMNMGIELCPWEANALREISRQYLSELLQSDKHDSPPPWVPEIDKEQGEIIVKRVQDVLRG